MHTLTGDQRSVLRSLWALGLDELADRAFASWKRRRSLDDGMNPHEIATIEGARLYADFDRANAQARTDSTTPNG